MSEFRGSFFKEPKKPKAKWKRPIKPVSDKTAERNARYRDERAVFLAAKPRCEAEWDDRCTLNATEVHHMSGRVGTAAFFRKDWWLAVCHHCHQKITTNPADAYERGLAFHRHRRSA